MRYNFRYTLEILRSEGLLDARLKPNDLAGLISHIFWSEPANFAVVHMLKSNVLSGLNADQLVLVLAHFFMPLKLPRSEMDYARQHPELMGPSLVVLPELPAAVRQCIREYNCRALRRLLNYTRCFVD